MPWKSLTFVGGFFGAVAGAFIWKARRKIALPCRSIQVAYGMPVGWFFAATAASSFTTTRSIRTFFLAVDNYQYGNLPIRPRHDLGSNEVVFGRLRCVLFRCWTRSRGPHGFYTGLNHGACTRRSVRLDFLRETDAKYSV